jgi:hypothetical protein
MKSGIFFWMMALLICLTSCNSNEANDNYDCSSDDPTEDIPWLKEIKMTLSMSQQYNGSQIIRYKYKGEFVFYIDGCYGCIDDIKSVYDCDGNIICEFGGYAGLNTCPDFEAEATDSTMLFNFVQP